jgi:hypothetical protein
MKHNEAASKILAHPAPQASVGVSDQLAKSGIQLDSVFLILLHLRLLVSSPVPTPQNCMGRLFVGAHASQVCGVGALCWAIHPSACTWGRRQTQRPPVGPVFRTLYLWTPVTPLPSSGVKSLCLVFSSG